MIYDGITRVDWEVLYSLALILLFLAALIILAVLLKKPVAGKAVLKFTGFRNKKGE